MGFKTDYKDITLKEFCNLTCIYKGRDVILHDYKGPLEHPITLTEIGCTVDDIPEIFADWYVEHLDINTYRDASDLINSVYIIFKMLYFVNFYPIINRFESI